MAGCVFIITGYLIMGNAALFTRSGAFIVTTSWWIMITGYLIMIPAYLVMSADNSNHDNWLTNHQILLSFIHHDRLLDHHHLLRIDHYNWPFKQGIWLLNDPIIYLVNLLSELSLNHHKWIFHYDNWFFNHENWII